MLWVKALHIVFMVTWFAGLFYLPRLFVYHAMATDAPSRARFQIMEYKLFWYIMTPGALVTCLLGFWLLWGYAWAAYGGSGWLHAKLALVGLLVAYHLACGRQMQLFAAEQNRRSHIWLRYFNEVPTLMLVGIVVLVVVKPF